MVTGSSTDLLQLTEHCGCGAKLSAADLRDLLSTLPQPHDPALLIGPHTFDDAAVYRLRDDCLVVQTVDFFPPAASEPRTFGGIAAANALSDIYAMGGRPLTALALMCLPSGQVPLGLAREVIEGAVGKLAEADVSLVGGHTLEDPQLKFGLSVMGVVEPGRMLTNAGAQPGDVVVLTKPMGTGLIITAAKAGLATQAHVQEANRSMLTLNRRAAQAAVEAGARAATDVTGFGLLGHTWQLAKASGVRVRLRAAAVPLLDGALKFASMGLVPAGAYANRRSLQGRVTIAKDVPLAWQDVLFDPQTSGGLLVCLPAGRSPSAGEGLPAGAEQKFQEVIARQEGCCCAVVGRIEAGDEEPRLIVEP